MCSSLVAAAAAAAGEGTSRDLQPKTEAVVFVPYGEEFTVYVSLPTLLLISQKCRVVKKWIFLEKKTNRERFRLKMEALMEIVFLPDWSCCSSWIGLWYSSTPPSPHFLLPQYFLFARVRYISFCIEPYLSPLCFKLFIGLFTTLQQHQQQQQHTVQQRSQQQDQQHAL